MELKSFANEFTIEFEELSNWRPIDAYRLRLDELRFPHDATKFTKGKDPDKGVHSDAVAYKFYELVRQLKPELVVETGVQNGHTTELALGALAINKTGQLISFDIGGDVEHGDKCTHRTWDGKPGLHVRKDLTTRWTLHLGNSIEEMEKVLPTLTQPIDIFHHDSNHTTSYIHAEVELVLPYMKPGGIICLHDNTNCLNGMEKEGKLQRLGKKNHFVYFEVLKK